MDRDKFESMDKFCIRLRAAWGQVPYMRFGQFISNVFSYSQQREGKDAFYLNEDEFMEMVNKFLKEIKDAESR